MNRKNLSAEENEILEAFEDGLSSSNDSARQKSDAAIAAREFMTKNEVVSSQKVN